MRLESFSCIYMRSLMGKYSVSSPATCARHSWNATAKSLNKIQYCQRNLQLSTGLVVPVRPHRDRHNRKARIYWRIYCVRAVISFHVPSDRVCDGFIEAGGRRAPINVVIFCCLAQPGSDAISIEKDAVCVHEAGSDGGTMNALNPNVHRCGHSRSGDRFDEYTRTAEMFFILDLSFLNWIKILLFGCQICAAIVIWLLAFVFFFLLST